MQANFYFINCLYIIETDHEIKDEFETKTRQDIGRTYHLDKDDNETTRPDVDNFLDDMVINIKSDISQKYEVVNISENDVEDSLGNLRCSECGSEVICEILGGHTGKGRQQRKYTIQLVLRSGYYCCYNLDFNVIQYNPDNEIININQNIRFRGKYILTSINAAIEAILTIFKANASEAYIGTIWSNGQTCYRYVKP